MTMTRETIIYVNKPVTKFKWLGYISFAQMGFVLVNFILMPTPEMLEKRPSQDKMKEQGGDQDSPSNSEKTSIWTGIKSLEYREIFSPKNIIENIIQRPITSTAVFTACALIPVGSFVYCKRAAHMITLLPNDRVRFTPFSVFGVKKPSPVELPLKDVSCVTGRESSANYSVLKFRGYLGYHLVHKTQGRFLKPKLYDEYLGYAKSWASQD